MQCSIDYPDIRGQIEVLSITVCFSTKSLFIYLQNYLFILVSLIDLYNANNYTYM